MKQVSIKKGMAAAVLVLLACVFSVVFRPSKVMALSSYGTDNFALTYMSSNYNSFGISLVNPNRYYVDTQILLNGAVVGESTGNISYASISVPAPLPKNTVYEYRIRMREKVYSGGKSTEVVGAWTPTRTFATLSTKGFKQKGRRSKAVKMTVPKVLGAKKVVVTMSTKKDSGYKKIATCKKKKKITVSSFKKKSFKKHKYYYYRIQVYAANGAPCDNYSEGYFYFY